MYVDILMGCKIFLRSDEAIDIEIEDFNLTLNIRRGNRVTAICVKVCGESDQGRKTPTWMWADDY
jgi:hypothetical protein